MEDEKRITEAEGVVMSEGSSVLKRIIKNDIEGGRIKEGLEVRQVQPVAIWDLNEALQYYKEGKLPIIGKGKNRGYELSGTLGVAGVLGFLVGGALLAKGKTALGAVGLGAGAGLEVSAYASLPKKVPIVGYYYGVREDVVGYTRHSRYVFVKLPLGLSDEAFEVRSKAQIRQAIKEGTFKIPSPIEIEEAIAREEHEDEVDSNASPSMPMPVPEQQEEQEDVLEKKEQEEEGKGSASPVLPSVIDPKSSKEKAAASSSSGVPGPAEGAKLP